MAAMSEDQFTPVTTDEQRLRQLTDYLEEHVACFADPLPVPPPRPAGSGAHPDWLAEVRTARDRANAMAARRPDAVVHAAMLVLGAGVNHTAPFTAYARPGTTWREVRIPVPERPGWPAGALARGDGGADPFPEPAPPAGVPPVAEIGATVFTPTEPTGAVVVAAHGATWWMGDGAAREAGFSPDCAALAERSGAIVVDVDYRLAPEHPLPAAVADLRAAVDWAAAELGATPATTVLWGTSSAGQVCTLAALTGAEVASLALTMPAVDLAGYAPATMAWIFGAAVDPASAVASPVHADPALLPRLHVQLASHDDMARGGAELAAAAAAAGGAAEAVEFLGTHLVTPPAVHRARITDLARHVLAATGTSRELPGDPAGEYDKAAVDAANEARWRR